MTKRIIAIFTGNRAEYGLQFPILEAVRDHANLDYRLIVSGAHLDPDFGETKAEIAADGFEIHAEVKIDLEDDSPLATPKAIGSGIIAMSKALNEIQPDMLLVYADRYEGFAAVVAATQMNLPTGHIEGGDITEGGALDDSIRHAMTKLSHLHFTTNQQASNRIMALGEEPWRVHTVGFPAIDMIAKGNYATPKELSAKLDIDINKPVVVFTMHSVTTRIEEADRDMRRALAAMKELATQDRVQVIVTYPNSDAGGRRIIQAIREEALEAVDNIQTHKSLGRYVYHGILAMAYDPNARVACVGNSSSGIKETPAFYCPAIDIGTRQKGRLRAENVMAVPCETNAIVNATRKALFDETFRADCRVIKNPYGEGNAGGKIAEIIANVSLDYDILNKRMTIAGEIRDGWYR